MKDAYFKNLIHRIVPTFMVLCKAHKCLNPPVMSTHYHRKCTWTHSQKEAKSGSLKTVYIIWPIQIQPKTWFDKFSSLQAELNTYFELVQLLPWSIVLPQKQTKHFYIKYITDRSSVVTMQERTLKIISMKFFRYYVVS